MMYKAKVAVCSDIHTKHSTQSERHVEFLNVKPWWNVKKPLGVKRLICVCLSVHFYVCFICLIILFIYLLAPSYRICTIMHLKHALSGV